MTRKVAIFIFDNVEVLDFAGPFEVFNVTSEELKQNVFEVFTVAEKPMVSARGGLSINPTYTFENCPQPDILIIPGGVGTRPLLKNETVLHWINTTQEKCEFLLSVCTGAMLLGKLGLLDGIPSTTHHTTFDEFRKIAPNTMVIEDKRFVDNGKIVTSGGISAGIDMSLYMVEKLLGREAVEKTVKEMEYLYWTPNEENQNVSYQMSVS